MRSWRLIIIGVAAWLTACATVPPPPVAPIPSVTPIAAVIEDYRAAAARGEAVYRVDAAHSLVVMRVYRGGSLARFGHDHVIASRDVRGLVLRSDTASAQHADVYAPLATLSVDEPALRAQAGFDTQPTQQDIEGTKRNMLDKVLEAERFPFVSLRLKDVGGEPPALSVSAAITLHGQTATIPLTVTLETPSAEQLYARGRFSVKQSDFGIVPLSLLGGALRVEDRLDIEFELAAARVTAADLR